MNWREVLIARILLIVARMVADDPVIAKEIADLSTHISVNGPKNEQVAA